MNIYTTFDTQFHTWNVMSENNECMFYGDIEELETWLVEHKGEYTEH